MVVISAVLPCDDAGAATLGFEDVPKNSVGPFVTEGVPVQPGEFFLLPSGSVPNGQYSVLDTATQPFTSPGGTGQYFFLTNVNLDFDFGGPVSQVSLLFGEFGGNLNLRVNGQLENLESLFLLPETVGGASVNVVQVPQTSLGLLTLTGNITRFAIGGQKFSFDSVQFIPVPEPSTLTLVVLGLLAVAISGWRRRYAAVFAQVVNR